MKIVHFETEPAARGSDGGTKTTMAQTMLPRTFDFERTRVLSPADDGAHEWLGTEGCYHAVQMPGADEQ